MATKSSILEILRNLPTPESTPSSAGYAARVHQAWQEIMVVREEICAAFIAKYGYGPEECVQVVQQTEKGIEWHVEHRPPQQQEQR